MTDGTAEAPSAARRRAVVDALELARLQVEVLTELRDAETRGDEDAVARAHATLDRVMADVARVEATRSGADTGADGDARSPVEELACGGCGGLAEPRYESPRLLGYTCPHCGWKTHDPAARAAGKLAEAKDAASTELGRAVPALEAALPDLRGRKPARTRGVAAVESVRDSLAEAHRRVENASG